MGSACYGVTSPTTISAFQILAQEKNIFQKPKAPCNDRDGWKLAVHIEELYREHKDNVPTSRQYYADALLIGDLPLIDLWKWKQSEERNFVILSHTLAYFREPVFYDMLRVPFPIYISKRILVQGSYDGRENSPIINVAGLSPKFWISPIGIEMFFEEKKQNGYSWVCFSGTQQ